MDTSTQQQLNVRELQRSSSPFHPQIGRNVHSTDAESYAAQYGSWSKEQDGSLRKAQALLFNQQANGAEHDNTMSQLLSAQNWRHAAGSEAKSQHSTQEEPAEVMDIDTGSGEASDTVAPDMDQECMSDGCQVDQEAMNAEGPDMESCSKKRCNESDKCDTDIDIDADSAQHNNPRDVLAQVSTIDRDCVMTDHDCASVLAGLKQQATYGFWVNRDSWWEDQDARPLFRRCGNNGKDNIDQPSVEAYQLWDYPTVPAQVILDMWKYLRLGEPITVRGKVVPSGTLFNEVIKALKEVKELYRAALSKAGTA